MKNVRVLLSLLIVALLAVSFVTGCGSSSDDDGGTDTGNVTGTVTDSNGNAISGATCTVTTTDLKAVYTDTTDEDGLFLITGVPTGTWPLAINKTGYQTLSLNVSISSGSTTDVPTDETVVTPSTGVGIVSGVVTDNDTAAAIEGATVAIGTFSATSSSIGAYTLSGVTAGSQTITATKSGYDNYSSTVTVVADDTVTKDIAMTSSAPEPGKGHVTGDVIDENGNALSGVTVTAGTITDTTDSNGEYTLMNLDPGVTTLSFAKTDYDDATVSVTVVADQTVTANTVTMTTGATTGSTVLCSVPRTTEDKTKASNGATVTDSGAYVAFLSKQPLLATHITTSVHVYLFSRASSTVTMLDVDPNGLEGNKAGAAATASDAFIAGDGSLIAFATDADNLLGSGIDVNTHYDVFVAHRTTGKISRVSVDYSNGLIGGYDDTSKTTGADSKNCGLSQDGGYVVFNSVAKNIVAPGFITDAAAHHTTVNVFRVKLTQATDGSVTTSAHELVSGRQIDGLECAPEDWRTTAGDANTNQARTSSNPYISRDGQFVVYTTDALPGALYAKGVAGQAPTLGHSLLNVNTGYRDDNAQHNTDIVLCDMSKSLNTRTMFASASSTGVQQLEGNHPACTVPTVSDDGTKVVFQCTDADSKWVTGNDANMDIWLKNMSSGQLSRVSNAGSGERGASTNGMISRDGTLVAFDSAGTGFVQNDTNASIDCFVYNIAAGTYQRVNLSSNNEQADNTGAGTGSTNPFLSGDNNYVTFASVAKNLTSNVYFTPETTDVFLRKWQ